MIDFKRNVLKNGLVVLVQEDHSTPMVAVNLAYNVGSRNDHPERTGFAHLFEHLMFGGSKNAKSFDEPIQMAGGDANAFTNYDHTCYHEILPAENLETALWLEADRMANLTLNKKALDTQRKVVVEEFYETCLNQPYGDLWHHFSKLCYAEGHPYRWPVIGLEPQHIKDAKLEDVASFFKEHYNPSNAVLSLVGNVTHENALALAEKYFGEIAVGPSREWHTADLVLAPTPARMHVKAKVPVHCLVMAFPVPARVHPDYYKFDLLSDLLGYGKSSRLYKRLIKEQKLFTEIDASLTGTYDPGLLVLEGKLAEGVTLEQAEAAVWTVFEEMTEQGTDAHEVQKLKNRLESNLVFGDIGVMNRATNLGLYELLGDANLINTEGELYQKITQQDLEETAKATLRPENCYVLWYEASLN